MLREARAAAALDHPNVSRSSTSASTHGSPYIAMEFVDGKTLARLLGEPPAPLRATQSAGSRTSRDALAAAHERGPRAPRLKPDNVMVRSDGVVKVLDFGIARRARRQRRPQGGD